MKTNKIVLFLFLIFWTGNIFSQHQPKKCIEPDLTVPESFSPNGDGENDILYAKAFKISEFYFTIFNKWGEKVYDSKYQNDGWDGRYKGADAKDGVYHWYLIVKCNSGEELKKHGSTTLVRK